MHANRKWAQSVTSVLNIGDKKGDNVSVNSFHNTLLISTMLVLAQDMMDNRNAFWAHYGGRGTAGAHMAVDSLAQPNNFTWIK